jgi:hypothetical protein
MMHVAGTRNPRPRLELWPKETARRFSGFIFSYLSEISEIRNGPKRFGAFCRLLSPLFAFLWLWGPGETKNGEKRRKK